MLKNINYNRHIEKQKQLLLYICLIGHLYDKYLNLNCAFVYRRQKKLNTYLNVFRIFYLDPLNSKNFKVKLIWFFKKKILSCYDILTILTKKCLKYGFEGTKKTCNLGLGMIITSLIRKLG